MSEEEIARGLSAGDAEKANTFRTFETGEKPKKPSQTEGFLADLRNRSNERDEPEQRVEEKSDTIYDIIGFLQAGEDDAPKLSQKAQLKEMKTTVVKLAANEDISPQSRDQLISFIGDNLNYWRKEAMKETPDKEIAEANQRIFGQFRETLYNRTDSDRDMLEASIAGGIESAETFSNTRTIDHEDDLTSKLTPPEDFENVTIKPKAAKETLIEISKVKPKELTYAHLYQFYDALGEDIATKEAKYKKKNPEWEAKAPIVLVADAFKNDHQEQAKEEGILICVTVGPDGEVKHTGWEPEEKNEPGSHYFTFDPNAPMDDENSLSRHVRNVNQFADAKIDVADAKAVVGKIERGETITYQERLSLAQLNESYAQEKYEKAREKMSEFITKHAEIDYSSLKR